MPVELSWSRWALSIPCSAVAFWGQVQHSWVERDGVNHQQSCSTRDEGCRQRKYRTDSGRRKGWNTEIMNNGSISLSFCASSSKFINGKRSQIPPCISCCQNGYEVDPKIPVQERMPTLALRIWLARKWYLLMPSDLFHLLNWSHNLLSAIPANYLVLIGDKGPAYQSNWRHFRWAGFGLDFSSELAEISLDRLHILEHSSDHFLCFFPMCYWSISPWSHDSILMFYILIY